MTTQDSSTERQARRMWQRLEAFHALQYFSPECVEALKGAGLKGFWMCYFAGRAAPMGAVPPEVVLATFFNFSPGVVRRAIPDAWSFASPGEVLAARLAGVDATLQRVFGDELSAPEVAEAADLAEAAVEAAVAVELPGRALFAGNAGIALGADAPAHLRLWQAVTCLREHRGDGHVGCLLQAGLDGCEALVTAAASGSVPRALLQGSRAWSDDEWMAAVERLAARGWVTGDGEFTDEGKAARAQIEIDTDRLVAGPYRSLGAERCERLGELVGRWSKQVVASGTVPALTPIGVNPD